MSEISTRYTHKDIEESRLSFWNQHKPSHAKANLSSKGKFTVMIPPPNVTGVLHMGHALNNTLQDILVRYMRMCGFDTLWMPGTDHAGIATQNVVEKQLAKEGITRDQLGRDKFTERLWEWKHHHGDTIIKQLHKLGSSCDWDRTRFTMDDNYSDAVREAFVRLYDRGLIYQGNYIINWCPRCLTALSDEEAEHKDTNGHLWHIKYPFKDNANEYVVVATTRPETMLGDTAVAVHPADERYQGMIGRTILLPLVTREIKIIADDFVDQTFGSGAVKVTPAHDPNDFAMGHRHKLPMLTIMHANGVMNSNAGVFEGMDRTQARKAIVKSLKEQGLLLKVDNHAHAVRQCYRCETIVEPYLSKQWFVKMKPLADKALAAFHEGKPRIQPKRWEKVYENWLVDIRDWCISRQIWWGHRIPVWYDAEGQAFCARNEADAQKLAFAKHGREVVLTQDKDVLDTWFSSWLWPFATLGWPQETPDLKYFYPTNTLFTAPEIIFFWVARMVMAGIEFTDTVPFNDVVLHGTVRDAKGRKMSKSLGNALDPLDVIEEFGADALRFSMILNSGQDIYISQDKFEIGRNFANKLWNASRFLLMNIHPEVKKSNINVFDGTSLDLASRWILSCYAQTVRDVSRSIEQFRYSEAESLLYDFFWGKYCDWYLEMIKTHLGKESTQKAAFFVLTNTLKLLHPFIPFVTEELYCQFTDKQTALTLEKWPQFSETLIDLEAESQVGGLIDLVSAVRNIRSQWGVKPQHTIKCILSSKNPQPFFVENIEIFKRLCRVDEVKLPGEVVTVANAATGVAGGFSYYIPLGDIIDLAKEKARIQEEIVQQEKMAASLELRLTNEAFVAKAPVEVIEKEKQRLTFLRATNEELTRALKGLQ